MKKKLLKYENPKKKNIKCFSFKHIYFNTFKHYIPFRESTGYLNANIEFMLLKIVPLRFRF